MVRRLCETGEFLAPRSVRVVEWWMNRAAIPKTAWCISKWTICDVRRAPANDDLFYCRKSYLTRTVVLENRQCCLMFEVRRCTDSMFPFHLVGYNLRIHLTRVELVKSSIYLFCNSEEFIQSDRPIKRAWIGEFTWGLSTGTKIVTLNDLKQHNGRYFALSHRIQ